MPKELVEGIIQQYKEEVKPAIDAGEYELAYFTMSNWIDAVNNSYKDIATRIHSGMNFMASMKLLHKSLDVKDKPSIDRALERFEAFSAQTKLPLK